MKALSILSALVIAAALAAPASAQGPLLPQAQWGSPGTAPGQFLRPYGIQVSAAGETWVADRNRSDVQCLDQAGACIEVWGGIGDTPGLLRSPQALAVDPQNRVYVADTYNNRVQIFTSSGVLIREVGSFGQTPGKFVKPQGIAVAVDGTFYVADGLRRIQKFDAQGNYLAQFGGDGSGPGRFSVYMGVGKIVLDGQGHLYALDPGNHRVQEFTTGGAFVTSWGSYGSGYGQFAYPEGIAVDDAGQVYVADTQNSRIEAFSSTGALLYVQGAFGTGPGLLNKPTGVAFHDGRIYVADTGNARVQVFAQPRWVPGTIADPISRDPGAFLVLVQDLWTLKVSQYDLSTLRLNGAAPLRMTVIPRSGIYMIFSVNQAFEGEGGLRQGVLTGLLHDGSPVAAVQFVSVDPAPKRGDSEAAGVVTRNRGGVVDLHFRLPEGADTRLTVFDIQGRVVERVVDGYLAAGEQSMTWSGAGLPSGVYFYRLEAGPVRATGKLILTR